MSYTPYLEALSNSRAYVYQSCKTRYALKYPLRVKPLPKSLSYDSWLRMFRGNVLHAGFEAKLLGENYIEYIRAVINEEKERPLTQEQIDILPTLQDESEIIVENLAEWLPISDFEPVVHNGKPLVEFQVTAPLQGWPGGFNGYLDGLVRHKPTGVITLIDWKTKQTFGAEGDEAYTMQMPLYLYALRHMGIAHVNRFALIEVKSTTPKRAPKAREDVGTFDGIRVSADGQCRWVPRFVSDAEIENTWAEFQALALSMSRFTPEYRYMSRSPFSCKSCEYKAYCDTKLAGGDVEYVLKQNYTVTPASLKVLL